MATRKRKKEKQYDVVISYSTSDTDPVSALATALAAIETLSGAYVEIFDEDSEDETVEEGDLYGFEHDLRRKLGRSRAR